MSLKGMGTSGCTVSHYTLIMSSLWKVRCIERLIRNLYITRVNITEKSVNFNLTFKKNPNNNKRNPQTECGETDSC